MRQYRGRETVYDVELVTATLARSLRNNYGKFWRKGSRSPMPDILKGISVANSLTFASRVRVRILKEICRRHLEANPGMTMFVTNYLPRPTLRLKDKGPIQTFHYADAVRRFSHHLSETFLTTLTRFARTNISPDQLKPLFLVLNADLLTPVASNNSSTNMDTSSAANPDPTSSQAHRSGKRQLDKGPENVKPSKAQKGAKSKSSN